MDLASSSTLVIFLLVREQMKVFQGLPLSVYLTTRIYGYLRQMASF